MNLIEYQSSVVNSGFGLSLVKDNKKKTKQFLDELLSLDVRESDEFFFGHLGSAIEKILRFFIALYKEPVIIMQAFRIVIFCGLVRDSARFSHIRKTWEKSKDNG